MPSRQSDPGLPQEKASFHALHPGRHLSFRSDQVPKKNDHRNQQSPPPAGPEGISPRFAETAGPEHPRASACKGWPSSHGFRGRADPDEKTLSRRFRHDPFRTVCLRPPSGRILSPPAQMGRGALRTEHLPPGRKETHHQPRSDSTDPRRAADRGTALYLQHPVSV